MNTSKVAIITAAGKGMGAACARALHRNGYRLGLMSPSGSASRLAQELDGVGVDGSVTEPADMERLLQATLDRFGRIDGLVNNTGHPPKGALLELSDSDWQQGFDLVLQSAVRACRLVVPYLREQGGGSIVNLSAFGAVEPSLDFPVSSALRAALSAYTKLLSEECAPHGIRVNSVLPGLIDSYPEQAEWVAKIPTGRYGQVEEVAHCVAFLLAEKSSYLTGQNLRVDGGLTRSL